jgi:hypothetical protein
MTGSGVTGISVGDISVNDDLVEAPSVTWMSWVGIFGAQAVSRITILNTIKRFDFIENYSWEFRLTMIAHILHFH